MNGFSRLAFVETKLFLRERAAAVAVFGLPVALVIGFGLIPGFGQPQHSLSGQIGTEFIVSVGVAIVLATLGLNGVPMVIGQYRERGILRRLGVTPVRPLTLLVAKLVVWAAAAILSVAVVVGVVRFAFHVPAPAAPGWFLLSVLLGIASVFALGIVVAAAAARVRAGPRPGAPGHPGHPHQPRLLDRRGGGLRYQNRDTCAVKPGCRSTRERSGGSGRTSLVSDDVTLPARARRVGGCGTPSY